MLASCVGLFCLICFQTYKTEEKETTKQQKNKTKLYFVTNSSLLINCNKKESDDVNKYTDKSFND